MQRFLDLVISIDCSTCFRRFLRPSSRAQNCTYSVRYCQTDTAAPPPYPVSSKRIWNPL